MANARKTAMKALVKLEREQGYSNIVIDNAIKNSELDSRDAGFASALFYGTLERKITLDYIIAKYSSRPLDKLTPEVAWCIRMAIYQMKYMDRVPESAAVNEAVKLIKATSMQQKSAGFVNAVLRSFLRDNKKMELPEKTNERMSIEYSCPLWIVDSFINDYGEQMCEGILKGFLESKYLSVRVNSLKISADEYIKKICDDGISAYKSDLCENAVVINNSGSIEKLYGYDEGLFHVQDIASQICAYAVNAKPGERVLDVCAAPGGKSFTIAENMNDTGEVVSLDLYDHKIKLINNGAERLGITCINAMINDAEKYNDKLGKYDKVLCDLPCSGLGILGKKPEIRYKNVAILDNIDELQYDLLCQSSGYVKVGGYLIYSTCSLRNAENRYVAERFLSNHPDFEAAPLMLNIKHAIDEPENMLTLMPHIHNTDGFFISQFVRTR